MGKAIKSFLTFVGGAVVAVLLIVAAGAVLYWHHRGAVPDRVVLELDLDREFIEYVPNDPMALAVLGAKPRLRDVVEGLERAAQDDRVAGLIVRLGRGPRGLGQIQELRDAVQTFRDSGKPAVAYAETLGALGPANGVYYLATGFDALYLQPMGMVAFTGLSIERPFLGDAMERLRLEPQFVSREEFKTAANQLTESGYTEAHEEMDRVLMELQYAQLVRGVAEGRGLPESVVRGLANEGPFSWEQAVEAGLVDGARYRDEVYEEVLAEAGDGAELMFLNEYLRRAGRLYDRGPVVALVHVTGPIVQDVSRYDPLFGEAVAGSRTIAKALRDAAEDDRVEAILLRIDSPGGLAVAADAIHREVARAREAGKPVVASMGNVAASGGYYVAMSADSIVAQPGALTGSIGVLVGKVASEGMWEAIGVEWEYQDTSANASIWSPVRPFTENQQETVERLIDGIYTNFQEAVAEHRGLDPNRAGEWSKGRVFTGEEARELGLVDELGGLPAALRLVRREIGAEADAPIELKPFPREKSLERLLVEGAFTKPPVNSEESISGTAGFEGLTGPLQTGLRLLRDLRWSMEPGWLYTPVYLPE